MANAKSTPKSEAQTEAQTETQVKPAEMKNLLADYRKTKQLPKNHVMRVDRGVLTISERK